MTPPERPDPDDEPEGIPFVALDIDPDATWAEIVEMLGLDRSKRDEWPGDDPRYTR